jgi:DNA-binding LacI/PurR family transcriptional regulator/anti-anti-sigma regulatory factor
MDTDAPIIGYHAPYHGGHFFREIRAGVYDALHLAGVRLVSIRGDLPTILEQGIAQHHIRGWISVSGSTGAEAIVQAGLPLVTIAHEIPGASSVRTNNAAGIRAVMQHLYELGHREIGFIGVDDNEDMLIRFDTYKAWLQEHGLNPDSRRIFLTANDDHRTIGYHLAQQLFAEPTYGTAIVAASDELALGIMRAAKEAGIRIPEDIVLVGYDDDSTSQSASPPLTTVRQSYYELGRVAAEQILRQLADPALAPAAMYTQATLIVRESCGAGQRITTDSNDTNSLVHDTPGAHMALPWQATLAAKLVETLLAPVKLAPHVQPETFWPGVSVMIATIEAVLNDTPLPTNQALQDAWLQANSIAVQNGILGNILDLIAEQVAALNLHNTQQQSMQQALIHLRNQLLTSLSAGIAGQITSFEDRLFRSDPIVSRITNAADQDLHTLNWFTPEHARWALLGLWADQSSQHLHLAGSFPAIDIPQKQLPVQAFPPLASMPAADSITIVPVRTSQNDWGMVAFGMEQNDRLSYLDFSQRWIELLGLRLDNRALISSLDQERQVIQESLDRERALSDTVRELGCPIIPLGNGTLLIPLIGLIDSARAQVMIETTLQAVNQQRAQRVLLDVTGVPLIDTHVAGIFVQLTQMVQLLGAETGIVGVRPEIAQSIVGLGVDLRQIRSYASLEMALSAIA